MQRIAIIGKSRTGTALAKAIRASGRYELAAHVAARSERFRATDAEVVVVAVTDDRIAEAGLRALAVAPQARLMVHLAGSLSPEILPDIAGIDRLMLHPIQTFAKPSPAPFEGITWAACSPSRAPIDWARRFTKKLGARDLFVLRPRDLSLYHAISVFAANFPVLLGVAIEEMALNIGIPATKIKQAVTPLVEQVLHNIGENPSISVLTGPIRRGDRETISRHSESLQKLDPTLWRIYNSFLEYAKENGLFGEPE